MVQETRREASKKATDAKNALKLNEEQRAAVTRYMRKLKDEMADIKSALSVINAAINSDAFTRNEQYADLEEAFDTIRDAADQGNYKTLMEKTEILLLAQINPNNDKFTVADVATVTDSKTKHWSVSDPKKFIKHIVEHDDYTGLLTKAVTVAWCTDYFDQYGKAPPGVDFFEKRTLSFTQPTKSRKKSKA